MPRFTCNLCGAACSDETLDREIASCAKCGSNVRFRWIVHALSVNLFGSSIPLKKFPRNKKIRGFGMSDPGAIAEQLVKRLDYRNTFYHRQPRFDIMETPADSAYDSVYDFVISSEVFEHVPPPVQTAFNNLAKVLKPGGFVVFSTPWESEGETIEHFPDLHDWQVVKLRSGHVLVNRTAEGRLQTFGGLTFHDGPGTTLEMRMFSHDGLIANCRAAGFSEIAFAEDYPEYGIAWLPWSRPMLLRR
ncbi:MAG TPA: class I SAM-dependent methyltransferase [Bryobacteraceae bacterium]|nr:class I SAM-dependent methyltransferase [Bryobacteraceae bacterium]